MDGRQAFVGGNELLVLRHIGEYRLTKSRVFDLYNVWHNNTLVAQGGRKLMTEVFEIKGEVNVDNNGQTIEHDASEVTQQGNPQPTQQVVAQAAPAAPVVMDIDKRIEQYVKLRDLIKVQDDAHKEKMTPYKEALEKLNGLLLQHLITVGGDSVKTQHGTVYKTVRRTVSLEDADTFMRHVIGGEHWELLDRKANSTAVEAYIQENGVLPPGVKQSSITQVGVRRS